MRRQLKKDKFVKKQINYDMDSDVIKKGSIPLDEVKQSLHYLTRSELQGNT